MHPSGIRPLPAILALAFILPCGSPARAGWFSRDQAPGTPRRPLLVAIGDPLARENSCACVAGFAQRDYPVLTNMISAELRRPVELVFCHSLQNATERAGRSPDLYIGKAPLPARCLARLTGPNGGTTLQGVFIVRHPDPAHSVPDLAGRRILLAPPEAVEKYGAALDLLRTYGMALPAKPLIADTCTAAALAVTRGEADAAVISDYAWPLLSACGAVDSESLRIVGRTDPVPFIGVFATGALSASEEAGILRALDKVSRSPRLRQRLESQDGFVPPSVEPVVPAPPAWNQLPRTPKVIWRHALAAQSLGGLAATTNRVIVSDKTDDLSQDAWHCLDAQTGALLWTVTYPAAGEMEYTSAPRATPVIAGDMAYLLGAFGDLICVELGTGAVRWRLNLVKRYGGKVPQWGFCGTPLVVGGNLIVQTGSTRAGLVALNRRTGRDVWRSPGSLPSYGSLILAHLGGRHQIIGHDSDSLGGWDPRTGRRLWRLVPPVPGDFNVPTPVKAGDMLLVSTEHNGTRLHTFNQDGTINPDPWAVTSALSPDISTPVFCNGLIWGGDSSGLHLLRVADKLQPAWESAASEFTQYMNLMPAPMGVLAASLSGQLLHLTPPPRAAITQATVFTATGEFSPESWSRPALDGSRVYWRSAREAICIDMGAVTPDQAPRAIRQPASSP